MGLRCCVPVKQQQAVDYSSAFQSKSDSNRIRHNYKAEFASAFAGFIRDES